MRSCTIRINVFDHQCRLHNIVRDVKDPTSQQQLGAYPCGLDGSPDAGGGLQDREPGEGALSAEAAKGHHALAGCGERQVSNARRRVLAVL